MIALIFCALVDMMLIISIKERKYELNNKYYALHVKYGFIKVFIVKIIIIYVTLDNICYGSFHVTTIYTTIILYYIFVFNLMKDFILEMRKRKQSVNENEEQRTIK